MSIKIRSRPAITFKGYGQARTVIPSGFVIRGLIYCSLLICFPFIKMCPADSVSAELKRQPRIWECNVQNHVVSFLLYLGELRRLMSSLNFLPCNFCVPGGEIFAGGVISINFFRNIRISN